MIIITAHAMQRWQERISGGRPAGEQEILSVFRDSCLVSGSDQVPFRRKSGYLYYRHASGIYFAARRHGANLYVRTVLLDRGKRGLQLLIAPVFDFPVLAIAILVAFLVCFCLLCNLW